MHCGTLWFGTNRVGGDAVKQAELLTYLKHQAVVRKKRFRHTAPVALNSPDPLNIIFLCLPRTFSCVKIVQENAQKVLRPMYGDPKDTETETGVKKSLWTCSQPNREFELLTYLLQESQGRATVFVNSLYILWWPDSWSPQFWQPPIVPDVTRFSTLLQTLLWLYQVFMPMYFYTKRKKEKHKYILTVDIV